MNKCIPVVSIVLLFILSPILLAEEVRDIPSVGYRIVSMDANNTGDLGSGIAIGENYILTNSHVVGGQYREVNCYDSSKQVMLTGRVICVSPAKDLAVIRTNQKIDYARFVPSTAKVGDTVRFFGFGRFGFPLVRKGTIVSTQKYSNKQTNAYYPTTSVKTEPGDSGGGVFNEQNELIGLCWGSDGTESYMIPMQQYIELADNYNNDLHKVQLTGLFGRSSPCQSCSSGQCSSGQCMNCPNGQCYASTAMQVAPRQNSPSQTFQQNTQNSVPSLPPPAPIPDNTQVAPPSSSANGGQNQINIDYDKVSSLVYAKMEENADKFRGLPGKDGVDGKNGIDGKNGDDWTSAPPITVNITDKSGKILSTTAVKPGDTLAIQTPEQHIYNLPVQSIDRNGKVIKNQEIPLDGKHALQLVPAK